MKKIVVCAVVSVLLILLPSMSIGVNIQQKPEGKPTAIGWTFIRGIITRPSLVNGGNNVVFHAIFVHYKTHGIGVTQSGFLHLFQTIKLPCDFIGILRNHYVLARFDGKLTPGTY
jgi:hypothetical protein